MRFGTHMPQASRRRARRGAALPVVIGLVAILGMLLARVQAVSTGQARLTATHGVDAAHVYLSEAVASRVVNRLKKRAWEVRFYAAGPPGTGPYGWSQTGVYRRAAYRVWVQDVSYGDNPAVPGLVDLFTWLELDGLDRRFHWRLSLLEPSPRRPHVVQVEYFGRTAEDLRTPAGRERAAEAATRDMVERDRRRDATDVVLRELPPALIEHLVGVHNPDPGDEPPATLAEALLGAGVTQPAESRSLLRDSLVRSIHLLGEDGVRFHGYLPPLQRGRFTYRAGDHGAAQRGLRDALRIARPEDLDLHQVGALVLASSYVTEAWQRGGGTPEGQAALDNARAVLREAADQRGAASAEDRAQVDPTVIVALETERARTERLGEDPGAEAEAVGQARTEGDGVGLVGGPVPVDTFVDSGLAPMGEGLGPDRPTSSDPVPPTGFAPVTPGEVDDFVGDPEGGWQGWPTDSGRPPDWWEDAWVDDEIREGEGGTGGPSGDIDRNGDGRDDPDILIGIDLNPAANGGAGLLGSLLDGAGGLVSGVGGLVGGAGGALGLGGLTDPLAGGVQGVGGAVSGLGGNDGGGLLGGGQGGDLLGGDQGGDLSVPLGGP